MENIKIIINGNEPKEYPKGITLLELSKEYQGEYSSPVVLAKLNQELRELRSSVEKDSEIQFYDLSNADSVRIYERSLSFVLNMAIKELYSEHKLLVHHSVNKGLYCEIKNSEKVNVTEGMLAEITGKMNEIIERDIPFEKIIMKRRDAIKVFEENKMHKKVQLFKYRNSSHVSLYKLDWLHDYFYGYMVPSTGYLEKFELNKKGNGFVLNYPTVYSPTEIPKIDDQVKLFNVFKEANDSAEIMNIKTVGDLNDAISSNNLKEMILVSEALQEKKIAQIADAITNNDRDISVVLIAGPSSSGKTTFSKRLSIQLKANGYNPHPISLDDYFVNREDTPVDENGEYDFESIYALDIEFFNDNINRLIAGEEIQMPTFNFKKGKREFLGNTMKLSNNDILVIEGIHGLNPILSSSIADDKKFKIYISALTQLNLDEHNRINTTDNRLLRRIVRDNNYRGHSAARTIGMWKSVRRGEEKNIFPYQEEADVMFNSALVYEIALLKQYAEPLLYNIDPSMPEYSEAKRLIKFLRYILGISSEEIPRNSLVREFIGGSYFY